MPASGINSFNFSRFKPWFKPGGLNHLPTLLKRRLLNIDWSQLQEVELPDSYALFKSSLDACIQEAIPMSRSPSKKRNIYINTRALQLRKKKESLWRQYVLSKKLIDYARFKHCKNVLIALTRCLQGPFVNSLNPNLLLI